MFDAYQLASTVVPPHHPHPAGHSRPAREVTISARRQAAADRRLGLDDTATDEHRDAAPYPRRRTDMQADPAPGGAT